MKSCVFQGRARAAFLFFKFTCDSILIFNESTLCMKKRERRRKSDVSASFRRLTPFFYLLGPTIITM